jgi:hypothetical protein
MLTFLVGRPEEMGSLGRHMNRWDDNIKMDIEEIVLRKSNGFIWLKVGASDGVI